MKEINPPRCLSADAPGRIETAGGLGRIRGAPDVPGRIRAALDVPGGIEAASDAPRGTAAAADAPGRIMAPLMPPAASRPPV